ncbi:hypothetical protein [Gordonia aichiensis]|uniref:hypothetical protein n=1 Tax=Gordonia aichiensis TaxID=36820 RepID=UPI001FDFA4F3|nr:hypothetical protein [Gordonia aichiensis]
MAVIQVDVPRTESDEYLTSSVLAASGNATGGAATRVAESTRGESCTVGGVETGCAPALPDPSTVTAMIVAAMTFTSTRPGTRRRRPLTASCRR